LPPDFIAGKSWCDNFPSFFLFHWMIASHGIIEIQNKKVQMKEKATIYNTDSSLLIFGMGD